jgi:hypothetical protein
MDATDFEKFNMDKLDKDLNFCCPSFIITDQARIRGCGAKQDSN